MWHSGVNTTRLDHAVIDPIINDLIAGAKPFGDLSYGQLLRPLELGRWNSIATTYPLDYLHRIRLTFGADLSVAIELIGDFAIGQGREHHMD